MKLSLGFASGNRALHLSIALALVFASTSFAELEDSTYTWAFASGPGGTVVTGSAAGTYTAPSNPGFCIGPPNDCQSGGVSSSFAFTNVSPTEDQITFSFAGSSAPPSAGSFKVDLLDIATTDGSTITGITYDSGGFLNGDGALTAFLSGQSLIFQGTDSTGDGFDAVGGATIVFDITETGGASAAPEPASLFLSGLGLAGLAIASIRRKRQA